MTPQIGTLFRPRGRLSAWRFRVLDVVPFEEEDESPFVGLLQVESA